MSDKVYECHIRVHLACRDKEPLRMLGLAPLLLLLHLSSVLGYDGCPNPEEVLCGDTCLDKFGDCVCGGAYVHYMVEWCCASAPCSMADPYHVSCPGTRLPLTSPCQAACNYHPEDPSFRSYAPCQDGRQCVREDDLCQGETLCQDGSDAAYCHL